MISQQEFVRLSGTGRTETVRNIEESVIGLRHAKGFLQGWNSKGLGKC
jgi:hypothetical protein